MFCLDVVLPDSADSGESVQVGEYVTALKLDIINYLID